MAAALAARRDVDGDVSTVPQVNLTILNIDPTQKVKAREVLQNQIKAAEKAGNPCELFFTFQRMLNTGFGTHARTRTHVRARTHTH